MVTNSGSSTPLWRVTSAALERPRLEEDARADVCVVGAGIAGLSVAYELLLERRSVIVIDQSTIAGGMTGRTTAHFTAAYDDRYFEIERVLGGDAARRIAQSHTAAIERAITIASRQSIECDLERVDGFLFRPPGDTSDVLERELDAARRAGLSDVSLVSRAPLAWDTGPALRFGKQMQLDPVLYMLGLAQAIERLGGRIHCRTHADTIEGGALARVQTEHGPRIEATAVVVATNSPVNDLAVIHTKQAAYQTYVIAAGVPRDSVTRALYWDTPDPYHYVRVQPSGSRDVLIIGGEDHKTGQEPYPDQRWRNLEAWARERFAELGPIEWRWSGQVMEPHDGVAFIGRNPMDADNVYVVTGDSGQGMTHGVIAGMLIRDLITGQPNPWAELYDPARRSLRALGKFARDNLDNVKEYAGWLAHGDVESVEHIPHGQGALIRRGLKLHAVHVDADGRVYENSAVCPHLGCVVKWNRAERSWDCPCHGSRFDAAGRVIHGPAIVDLAPANAEVAENATHAT